MTVLRTVGAHVALLLLRVLRWLGRANNAGCEYHYHGLKGPSSAVDALDTIVICALPCCCSPCQYVVGSCDVVCQSALQLLLQLPYTATHCRCQIINASDGWAVPRCQSRWHICKALLCRACYVAAMCLLWHCYLSAMPWYHPSTSICKRHQLNVSQ